MTEITSSCHKSLVLCIRPDSRYPIVLYRSVRSRLHPEPTPWSMTFPTAPIQAQATYGELEFKEGYVAHKFIHKSIVL